jgi:hypothetical protein
MVAEERKHLYHGTRNVRLFDRSEGTPTDRVLIPNPQGAQEMAAYWRDFVAQIEDANEHRKLKESHIDYIWEKVGQLSNCPLKRASTFHSKVPTSDD